MSFINLGLVKYQNRIAAIAGYNLTKEELEEIDLSNINYPTKRNISKPVEVLYKITFDSNIKLEILDIIQSNQYTVNRFTCIRVFKDDNAIQLDIKCKYNKKNIHYLNIILAKAINFAQYKNIGDIKISQSVIINNFAKRVLSIISKEVASEINFLLNILLSNDEFIKNDDFDYSYGIGDISMELCIKNKNIIKFSVHNSAKNKTEYMYFCLNKVGISNILLVADKIIKPGTD